MINRLIIYTTLSILTLTGCNKNNPPDGYIILYNDIDEWTYASPIGYGDHDQSLSNYSSKTKAIRAAWKYFEWKKEREAHYNWHEYKENKQ